MSSRRSSGCAPTWSCRRPPTCPHWPTGPSPGCRWPARSTASTGSRSRCSMRCATPPPARAILDRLAAGPPVGAVTAAGLAAADVPGDAESPVRWLVDRHLLVPISHDAVELPVEVGLLLRRESGPLGVLHPDPPP